MKEGLVKEGEGAQQLREIGKKRKLSSLFLLFIILTTGFFFKAYADTISANIAVEKTEVFIGEPFIVQIQVNGTSNVKKPEITSVKGFDIVEQGARNNSSSSVTIINGRVTSTEKKGFIYSYQFTPQRIGLISIPSIKVFADGNELETNPINIKVTKPAESEDFKLLVKLDKNTVYVGQPLNLKVTWYIGKNIEEFQFSLPILNDNLFEVESIKAGRGKDKRELIQIPAGDKEFVGEKGKEELNGRSLTTVTFNLTVIPKKTGMFKLPSVTVVFNAIMGYRNRGSRTSSLDNFFNDDFFFGKRRNKIRKKFVLSSNQPDLMVNSLPFTGRPDNFTGLVGEYNIIANAAPVQVNVGDPITINLKVTGDGLLKKVKLPRLSKQKSIVKDFKVPEEMAPGKLENGAIVFTQTLRAKHADVKGIPPIELPFFNVKKGKYMITRTAPIPLEVKSTRIVTVEDAEGLASSKEVKVELESLKKGIAYNYEDLSILKNKVNGPLLWVKSPLWIGIVTLPPISYFLLLIFVKYKHAYKVDSVGRQRRKAYGNFIKSLNNIDKTEKKDITSEVSFVLDSFRQYFGSRLCLAPGSITYDDVREILEKKGINKATLENLEKIFEEGEAIRFAGFISGKKDTKNFIDKTKNIVKNIEQEIK